MQEITTMTPNNFSTGPAGNKWWTCSQPGGWTHISQPRIQLALTAGLNDSVGDDANHTCRRIMGPVFEAGRLYKSIYQVKWDAFNNGSLRWWVDSGDGQGYVKYADWTGVSTLYRAGSNPDTGTWPTLLNYRKYDTSLPTSIMYYGGFIRGSTMEDVVIPSSDWPPTGAYFYDDFSNGLTKWSTEGTSSSFAIVDDGSGGKALTLTVTPTSSGPNASSELAAVYLGAQSAHSGYQTTNEETWYRTGVRFPSGSYIPTTGEWNWLVEWHTDNKTQVAGGNSTGMSVLTDYPVTTSPGQNPRLRLRNTSGSPSNPTYNYFTLPSNSLLYSHWYDSVYHIIWSTNPNIGLIEWWLDGQQIASYRGATLYTNSDGTLSYNNFGLYNYRLHATWNSTVQFRKVIIGPSAASIGFSTTPPPTTPTVS
ncbi:MAG TPA: heparin lyase I family protein, partial [Candidatus Saccharimonadales bacterium]|nr:heparin lyase I family protein [Candidatus Saccharimonadales bacterium]